LEATHEPKDIQVISNEFKQEKPTTTNDGLKHKTSKPRKQSIKISKKPAENSSNFTKAKNQQTSKPTTIKYRMPKRALTLMPDLVAAEDRNARTMPVKAEMGLNANDEYGAI